MQEEQNVEVHERDPSVMVIKRFISANWTHEKTVDVVLEIEEYGVVTYHATPYDEVPHGKQLWEDLMAGRYGTIGRPKSTKASYDVQIFKMERGSIIRRTQWMVDRHRDQKELGAATSLTEAAYMRLQRYRQDLRDAPSDGKLSQVVVPDWIADYLSPQ